MRTPLVPIGYPWVVKPYKIPSFLIVSPGHHSIPIRYFCKMGTMPAFIILLLRREEYAHCCRQYCEFKTRNRLRRRRRRRRRRFFHNTCASNYIQTQTQTGTGRRPQGPYIQIIVFPTEDGVSIRTWPCNRNETLLKTSVCQVDS